MSRSRGPGLATRFLRANRNRNGLLVLVIAVAVAGVVLIGQFGETAVRRADTAARSRFGEATITLPATDEAILIGGGGWITREQTEQIEEILAVESLTVSPGVEADAFIVRGGELIPALVLATDGDFDPSSAPSRTKPGEIDSILIGTADTAGSPTGFLDLASDGLNWTLDRGTEVSGKKWIVRTSARELLRFLRDGGSAPVDTVGNRLQIGSSSAATATEPYSSAVIAYNAAELLMSAFPGVTVLSCADYAGRARQLSARNIALLVQVALILPALAAIVGSALVTAESRDQQIALLRTLGFGSSAIRRIFVQESFLVSTGATIAGLVVGIGISTALPAAGPTSVPIVPVALCGAVIPPGLTLLSLRRFSAKPLHDQLAESNR